MKNIIQNLISLKGRINRLKYNLINIGLIIFLIIIDGIVSFPLLELLVNEGLYIFIIYLFLAIVFVAMYIFFIISLKRFNDIGFPLKYTLSILIFIFLFIFLEDFLKGYIDGNIIKSIKPAILVISLYLMFKKGEDGDNKYGKDPLKSEK